jgi:hypothetical protein
LPIKNHPSIRRLSFDVLTWLIRPSKVSVHF